MIVYQTITISLFLLLMLGVYVWASQRNLAKVRPWTHHEYLWRLKQITGKSEYEIFCLAAQEKGWPDYYVEKHFKRYLQDQTLPVYVQQFIEDGKEYIETYRPMRGNVFDKRVVLFFSVFATLVIGGSFVFCLVIYPRIFQFDYLPNRAITRIIEVNPRLAAPFIDRALAFGSKGQTAKACADLMLACDAGYCEDYLAKKREGMCP